ncbi:MAG: dihydrodipicolinate synthase family protein [Candidatus Omnitrophica bacterium]|nr:dihydrodipicolinate synthase family protein [Candidatus Omnitrophota bacterium]
MMLVFMQTGLVTALFFSWVVLRERKDWKYKGIGIAAIAISIAGMLFAEWSGNPVLFGQWEFARYGILAGALFGLPGVLYKKMFRDIDRDKAGFEETKAIVSFLPMVILMVNYIFGTMALGFLMLKSQTPFLVSNGNSIWQFAPIIAIILSAFCFVCNFMLNWKLMRLVDVDLSRIAPLLSSSPMIAALISLPFGSKPFASNCSYLMLFSVIAGAFISAKKDGKPCLEKHSQPHRHQGDNVFRVVMSLVIIALGIYGGIMIFNPLTGSALLGVKGRILVIALAGIYSVFYLFFSGKQTRVRIFSRDGIMLRVIPAILLPFVGMALGSTLSSPQVREILVNLLVGKVTIYSAGIAATAFLTWNLILSLSKYFAFKEGRSNSYQLFKADFVRGIKSLSKLVGVILLIAFLGYYIPQFLGTSMNQVLGSAEPFFSFLDNLYKPQGIGIGLAVVWAVFTWAMINVVVQRRDIRATTKEFDYLKTLVICGMFLFASGIYFSRITNYYNEIFLPVKGTEIYAPIIFEGLFVPICFTAMIAIDAFKDTVIRNTAQHPSWFKYLTGLMRDQLFRGFGFGGIFMLGLVYYLLIAPAVLNCPYSGGFKMFMFNVSDVIWAVIFSIFLQGKTKFGIREGAAGVVLVPVAAGQSEAPEPGEAATGKCPHSLSDLQIFSLIENADLDYESGPWIQCGSVSAEHIINCPEEAQSLITNVEEDLAVYTLRDNSEGPKVAYISFRYWGSAIALPADDDLVVYTRGAANCPLLIMRLIDGSGTYHILLSHVRADLKVDIVQVQIENVIDSLKERNLTPTEIIFMPSERTVFDRGRIDNLLRGFNSGKKPLIVMRGASSVARALVSKRGWVVKDANGMLKNSWRKGVQGIAGLSAKIVISATVVAAIFTDVIAKFIILKYIHNQGVIDAFFSRHIINPERSNFIHKCVYAEILALALIVFLSFLNARARKIFGLMKNNLGEIVRFTAKGRIIFGLIFGSMLCIAADLLAAVFLAATHKPEYIPYFSPNLTCIIFFFACLILSIAVYRRTFFVHGRDPTPPAPAGCKAGKRPHHFSPVAIAIASAAIMAIGPIVVKHVNNLVALDSFSAMINTTTTFFLSTFLIYFAASLIKERGKLRNAFRIPRLWQAIAGCAKAPHTRLFLILVALANAVSGWFFFAMLGQGKLDPLSASIIFTLSPIVVFGFSRVKYFTLDEDTGVKQPIGRAKWASIIYATIGAIIVGIYGYCASFSLGIAVASTRVGLVFVTASVVLSALREVSTKKVTNDYKLKHGEEIDTLGLVLGITQFSYFTAGMFSLIVSLILRGIDCAKTGVWDFSNLLPVHYFMLIVGLVYGIAYLLRYYAQIKMKEITRMILFDRMNTVFNFLYMWLGFGLFGIAACKPVIGEFGPYSLLLYVAVYATAIALTLKSAHKAAKAEEKKKDSPVTAKQESEVGEGAFGNVPQWLKKKILQLIAQKKYVEFKRYGEFNVTADGMPVKFYYLTNQIARAPPEGFIWARNNNGILEVYFSSEELADEFYSKFNTPADCIGLIYHEKLEAVHKLSHDDATRLTFELDPDFATRIAQFFLPIANITPTVTPLLEADRIDPLGVRKVVQNIVRIGGRAIFAMGRTGEFPELSNGLRMAALKVAIKEAKRLGIPVFAGVTADTEKETLDNICELERMGADYIVLAPLYYLDTNAEIIKHFERIDTYLPILLYNNPSPDVSRGLEKNITRQTLEKLQGRIVGIKDSSGKLDILKEYLEVTEVYQGNEGAILEALRLGARGAVGSMGNVSVLPELLCRPEIPENVKEKIQEAIIELRMPLTANLKKIYSCLKYALKLSGICRDTVVLDNVKLTREEKADVVLAMNGLRITLQRYAKVATPASVGQNKASSMDCWGVMVVFGILSDKLYGAQNFWLIILAAIFILMSSPRADRVSDLIPAIKTQFKYNIYPKLKLWLDACWRAIIPNEPGLEKNKRLTEHPDFQNWNDEISRLKKIVQFPARYYSKVESHILHGIADEILRNQSYVITANACLIGLLGILLMVHLAMPTQLEWLGAVYGVMIVSIMMSLISFLLSIDERFQFKNEIKDARQQIEELRRKILCASIDWQGIGARLTGNDIDWTDLCSANKDFESFYKESCDAARLRMLEVLTVERHVFYRNDQRRVRNFISNFVVPFEINCLKTEITAKDATERLVYLSRMLKGRQRRLFMSRLRSEYKKACRDDNACKAAFIELLETIDGKSYSQPQAIDQRLEKGLAEAEADLAVTEVLAGEDSHRTVDRKSGDEQQGTIGQGAMGNLGYRAIKGIKVHIAANKYKELMLDGVLSTTVPVRWFVITGKAGRAPPIYIYEQLADDGVLEIYFSSQEFADAFLEYFSDNLPLVLEYLVWHGLREIELIYKGCNLIDAHDRSLRETPYAFREIMEHISRDFFVEQVISASEEQEQEYSSVTIKEMYQALRLSMAAVKVVVLSKPAHIDPLKVLNRDNEYFMQAVEYFNDSILATDACGNVPALTWDKVIDLYELFRGDRSNLWYDAGEREKRLSFCHAGEIIDQANAICDSPDNVVTAAVNLFVFIAGRQLFAGEEMVVGGVAGFNTVKDLSEYNGHSYGASASGHHRLAWFLMNWIFAVIS